MTKPTLKTVLTEMIKKELKSILSETSSTVSSLSPGAQKALDQSKIAKQNKDVQKKRAAAKDSMRGMSVEGCEPDLEEQILPPGNKGKDIDYSDFDFDTGMWTTAEEDEYPYDDDDSENPYLKGPTRTNDVEYYSEQHRIEGDKLHSDEGDFFDTIDLHGEDEFENGGFGDATPGVIPYSEFEDDFWPEDETVQLPEQSHDDSYQKQSDKDRQREKEDQKYQADLDDERDERDFQRSGGGRRADWEWQY